MTVKLQPARARPDREQRGDAPAHVGWADRSAPGDRDDNRRRPPAAAALAQPRRLVRPRPRHQGARPCHRRRRALDALGRSRIRTLLVFEHGGLYNTEGEPGESPAQPDPWSAAWRRHGEAASVITYGGSLPKCLARLTPWPRGVLIDVLDLRSLRPLDEAAILATARSTRHVVVVDEGWRSGSLSAEVSRITELARSTNSMHPCCLCAQPRCRCHARHLEEAALPQPDGIATAVEQVIRGGWYADAVARRRHGRGHHRRVADRAGRRDPSWRHRRRGGHRQGRHRHGELRQWHRAAHPRPGRRSASRLARRSPSSAMWQRLRRRRQCRTEQGPS